jgi:hypothetical protein
MHVVTVSRYVKMAPFVVQENVQTSLKIQPIVAAVHLYVPEAIRVVAENVPIYKPVTHIVDHVTQYVVREPHVVLDHARISATIQTTAVHVVWSAISVVPVDYVHVLRHPTVVQEKSAVVAVVWAHNKQTFFFLSFSPPFCVLIFLNNKPTITKSIILLSTLFCVSREMSKAGISSKSAFEPRDSINSIRNILQTSAYRALKRGKVVKTFDPGNILIDTKVMKQETDKAMQTSIAEWHVLGEKIRNHESVTINFVRALWQPLIEMARRYPIMADDLWDTFRTSKGDSDVWSQAKDDTVVYPFRVVSEYRHGEKNRAIDDESLAFMHWVATLNSTSVSLQIQTVQNIAKHVYGTDVIPNLFNVMTRKYLRSNGHKNGAICLKLVKCHVFYRIKQFIQTSNSEQLVDGSLMLLWWLRIHDPFTYLELKIPSVICQVMANDGQTPITIEMMKLFIDDMWTKQKCRHTREEAILSLIRVIGRSTTDEIRKQRINMLHRLIRCCPYNCKIESRITKECPCLFFPENMTKLVRSSET